MRVVSVLLLSGVVGIFLGDTALFLTLEKLGPRVTSILFATSGPITAVLGFLILGEKWQTNDLAGTVLMIVGIFLAIFFKDKKKENQRWEFSKSKLGLGIFTGLTAAFCQSTGILLSREVMRDGTRSRHRFGVQGRNRHGLSPFFRSLHQNFRRIRQDGFKIFIMIFLSGSIGMLVGMTLIMFALRGGNSGIVATLSSTTPVLILPLLWITTGKSPAWGAWSGALLTVIGTDLFLPFDLFDGSNRVGVRRFFPYVFHFHSFPF